MKTRKVVLVVVLSLLLQGVSACAPGQAPPPSATPPASPVATPDAETTDPNASLVLNMVDRLNAGDVEGSMAYFADDAMAYIAGLPPTGIEVYQGAGQIRSLWEDSRDNHYTAEVKVSRIEANIIYAQTETWHDFTRQLGIAPLQWGEVYEVDGGKIVTYGSWLLPAELDRIRPVLAAAMSPDPDATPQAVMPVSNLEVVVQGGTCTTDSPLNLAAGEVGVDFEVIDTNNQAYALTMFTLDPDKDQLDLMAATAGVQPSWSSLLKMIELGPGQETTSTFTAEEGPVYVVCWSKYPDLAIGALGPFQVSPPSAATEAAAQPQEGPGDQMTVSLSSGGCVYGGPTSLKQGEISVAMNVKDSRAYALTFFTLAPGKDLQDLIAAQDMPSPPTWATMFSMKDTVGGESVNYTLSVEEGPVYMLCWRDDAVIGSQGPLEVAK